MFQNLGELLDSYKEDQKGELGQIEKDLGSQAEKYVLNLDGSMSSRRYMDVGTM